MRLASKHIPFSHMICCCASKILLVMAAQSNHSRDESPNERERDSTGRSGMASMVPGRAPH